MEEEHKAQQVSPDIPKMSTAKKKLSLLASSTGSWTINSVVVWLFS
jgi:hypothetical protein